MGRVNLDELELVANAAIARPDDTDDADRLEFLADLARDAVQELRDARVVVEAVAAHRASYGPASGTAHTCPMCQAYAAAYERRVQPSEHDRKGRGE